MGDNSTGMVTFLFTDIEGSTRRWEADPDEMQSALATNDGITERSFRFWAVRGMVVTSGTWVGRHGVHDDRQVDGVEVVDEDRRVEGVNHGAVGDAVLARSI